MKRYKTEYPGVFYREAKRIGGRGKEKVFYVVFKKAGKVLEEKAGRQYADDMTSAKAARVRSDRIEGRRESPKEKREAQKATKDQTPWTIKTIWDEYKKNNPGLKGLTQDECRFTKHIDPSLGKKEPSELSPQDVDSIRIKLLMTLKPATVRNVLELLRRIINYAREKQLSTIPFFKIEMPAVNNLKTEDLNEEQMEKLLTILRNGIVIEKDGTETLLDIDAREAMLLALITGMRKSEIFKLMWADVDFQRDFINIRDPKGVKDQIIPLSDAARGLLKQRTATKGSPYVFPGRKKGSHRVDASKQFRLIRAAAALPKDFRPMHGLRHTFASGLASSGEVDLYTLQRLLTHKSPAMTMRYAHLRDETLRKASNLAGNIIDQAAKAENTENETATE